MRHSAIVSTRVRLGLALAAVVVASVSALAQPGVPQGATGRTEPTPKTGSRQAQRTMQSLINGVAVNGQQTPVPKATIRLRNLQSNQIEETVVANDAGEFSFVARPGVAYVVEIVDQSGRTVAVGDVVIASDGEVAGAKISVPSGLPVTAHLFDGSARSVVSAAIVSGLPVVDPMLPKLSPKQ